jgi:hypothetical protein
MGKFNGNADNIYQLITGQLSGGVYSKPSYFNGTVYYGAVNDTIEAFPIRNALLANSPSSHCAQSFPYPGATPYISASGTTNGIVWAVENSSPTVLHAYDATNLANDSISPIKPRMRATTFRTINSSHPNCRRADVFRAPNDLSSLSPARSTIQSFFVRARLQPACRRPAAT